MSEEFENRLINLKSARNNLLNFHKILIDRERQEIERSTGTVTPGQFLGMLMNDENFEWLRTISKLVVKIDESFELNDGVSVEKLERYETEIIGMFDDSDSNQEFKRKIEKRLPKLPDAERIKDDIKRLMN